MESSPAYIRVLEEKVTLETWAKWMTHELYICRIVDNEGKKWLTAKEGWDVAQCAPPSWFSSVGLTKLTLAEVIQKSESLLTEKSVEDLVCRLNTALITDKPVKQAVAFEIFDKHLAPLMDISTMLIRISRALPKVNAGYFSWLWSTQDYSQEAKEKGVAGLTLCQETCENLHTTALQGNDAMRTQVAPILADYKRYVDGLVEDAKRSTIDLAFDDAVIVWEKPPGVDKLEQWTGTLAALTEAYRLVITGEHKLGYEARPEQYVPFTSILEWSLYFAHDHLSSQLATTLALDLAKGEKVDEVLRSLKVPFAQLIRQVEAKERWYPMPKPIENAEEDDPKQTVHTVNEVRLKIEAYRDQAVQQLIRQVRITLLQYFDTEQMPDEADYRIWVADHLSLGAENLQIIANFWHAYQELTKPS